MSEMLSIVAPSVPPSEGLCSFKIGLVGNYEGGLESKICSLL